MFLKLCIRSSFGIARVNHINFHKYISSSSKLKNNVDVVTPQSESAIVGQYKNLPIITSRKLDHLGDWQKPKQAWLESLSTTEDQKLGIVDLHPSVFGCMPRLDVLWWNIHWQRTYKEIDYSFEPSKAELKGGGRKPWPQKGTGRARHGSIRSPLFIRGAKTYGPRGPKSKFYMLPTSMRTLGLCTSLTFKYNQDNLHIVDTLDIPSEEPEYLTELVESRGWGLSVLFIDNTDFAPRNIALACDKIKQYNIMPVYGLNVFSMLKHETLIITLAALEELENKLLLQMFKNNANDYKFNRLTASHLTQPKNF